LLIQIQPRKYFFFQTPATYMQHTYTIT